MSSDPSFSGILSPANAVGRHFAIVGGLTTVVALSLPIALIAAGAPAQRPSLDRAAQSFGSLGFAQVAVFAVLVLAANLALHPFQFAITQVLEGYWGASAWSRRAMQRSIRRHVEVQYRHDRLFRDSGWETADFDEQIGRLKALERCLDELGALTVEMLDTLEADRHRLVLLAGEARVAAQESFRLLSRYPVDPSDTMPTRLGNMLRRHERTAGHPYGLDAVVVTGLLAQVADQTLRDYHDDARSDLDLAVRMVAVWTFATVAGLALLWPYDLWLVVPLITTALVAVSYRGAVQEAASYGEALATLVALGRGDLYRALHVEFPDSSRSEIRRNRLLSQTLAGERARKLTFVSDARADPGRGE